MQQYLYTLNSLLLYQCCHILLLHLQLALHCCYFWFRQLYFKVIKIRDECPLYIPPAYFYRSLFVSMQVSLGIISLLPEGLFLTFSSNISLLVTNSFSFCLKNFHFFIFERYIHFSGYSILDILIFFFQHFETVSPLSSGLYTF